MNIVAPIIGISRHRLLTDGEGVTTLVAFHSCPLCCNYCVNPQCNTPAGIKDVLSPQQLYERVKIDDIYFIVTGGGIMFGGGEPLLWTEFIKEFRKICGDRWRIYVETSLNVDRSAIEPLLEIIDYWVVDVKDWNNDIYYAYTGKDNSRVKANLEYLITRGLSDKMMVRVPAIPEYNTREDIENTIDQLTLLGIKYIDKFEYIQNVESIHKKDVNINSKKSKGGKLKCEILKNIRIHAAECNNIVYTPHNCEHTFCATGCCSMCDKELAWLTKEYYKINNGAKNK